MHSKAHTGGPPVRARAGPAHQGVKLVAAVVHDAVQVRVDLLGPPLHGIVGTVVGGSERVQQLAHIVEIGHLAPAGEKKGRKPGGREASGIMRGGGEKMEARAGMISLESEGCEDSRRADHGVLPNGSHARDRLVSLCCSVRGCGIGREAQKKAIDGLPRGRFRKIGGRTVRRPG